MQGRFFRTLALGCAFAVGFLTGRRGNAPSAARDPASDDVQELASSADLEQLTNASRPSRVPKRKALNLATVPTSILKREYERRMDRGAQERLFQARFPKPESEQQKVEQTAELYEKLGTLRTASRNWKGGIEAAGALGDSQDLTFYLDAMDLSEFTDGATGELSRERDLDFSVVLFSEGKRGYEHGSHSTAFLRELRKLDGQLYIVGEADVRPWKGKYSHYAVSIPQPGLREGNLELLDIDTGKWIKMNSFDWQPMAREDFERNVILRL